jgi:acetoin utilization deacetylase AcuC-like enzyme
MAKFPGLHDYLVGSGLFSGNHIIEPTPASRTLLSQVHSNRYLNAILDGEIGAKEERRLGLPWSKALAMRSQLAVQGTLNAALMALEDGMSGNLAGGTHHALPDLGEGFCVFNDVAVAVKTLHSGFWAKNILIFDCDVHQGNGTAQIFQNHPNVFTVSLHGENNYPFKKVRSSLDVGLADNTADQAYLDILEQLLLQTQKAFKPDLVFYLGGIDVLQEDRFGRLNLSLDGLRQRDRMVIRHFQSRDIPLVLLLSGGYAPTVEKTVQAHAVMFEEAVRIFREL